MDRSNNPQYMKEYLHHALEFEKYVYIWSQSMNKANNQMRSLQSRRNNLIEDRKRAEMEINSFDIKYSEEKSKVEKKDALNKKRAVALKKKSRVFLVLAVVIILIFAVLGVFLINSYIDSAPYGENVIVSVFKALMITLSGYIFTLAGPIFLILHFVFKFRAKRYGRLPDLVVDENSLKEEDDLWRTKAIETDNRLSALSREESTIGNYQEEIARELSIAKNNLANIYEEGVLPAKYRSFNAVATLLEYLESGRCNAVQGHGGIYDTYEVDLRQGIIIENLVSINNRLASIESNQRMLFRELQQANRSLSQIESSLVSIERTNAEIARNTAVSAVADQQTAAAANWMSWRMWANG
ncbi:MAG: hypothetical protein ACI4GZ_04330 [Ruminococcus sp.]